ncbi:MAG: ATP-binding cassette domain-containing protein [Rickettsiales bacterium]|jgi:putative ABC transport system ATP-binding protein|nr:ATP-binding cassette domain-containing protein [Rickettsiales bacterium]
MLNLKNVEKSFSGNFAPVLKGINLDLSHGEFCIVIGSNGSGKSTLMRSISGEYSIDSGVINTNNKIIASVTQDINKGTIPEMTLLENIVLSKLLAKSASFNFYKNQRDAVISIVKELGIGLEDYIDQPLSSLSGGQRQMIATLMAVHAKPDIMLLDEHTSALDPKAQKLLIEYTAKSIVNNKITALMITHKLDDAISYGDRLIMLHQGEIVLDLKGEKKKALTVKKLLDLFHKYEDLTLRSKS